MCHVLPDFHAPAGTFLGSWCWHSVPSLGTRLEGGTTDKLAKDSGDEKRLKKSVRAAKQKAVKRPRYNNRSSPLTLACDQALLLCREKREREGEREKGRSWGTSQQISDIIGQALSQLFTLLSECYDNNAIRTCMNMFMSARAVYNV